MDTKPLMFDIVRYVQRCDDHTVVCETYPSACGFGWSFLWSEGMRHWINAYPSLLSRQDVFRSCRQALAAGFFSGKAFHMSQPSLTSPPG